MVASSPVLSRSLLMKAILLLVLPLLLLSANSYPPSLSHEWASKTTRRHLLPLHLLSLSLKVESILQPRSCVVDSPSQTREETPKILFLLQVGPWRKITMSKTSCHYFKWVFLVDLWYKTYLQYPGFQSHLSRVVWLSFPFSWWVFSHCWMSNTISTSILMSAWVHHNLPQKQDFQS